MEEERRSSEKIHPRQEKNKDSLICRLQLVAAAQKWKSLSSRVLIKRGGGGGWGPPAMMPVLEKMRVHLRSPSNADPCFTAAN